jgi:hypothetical protein
MNGAQLRQEPCRPAGLKSAAVRPPEARQGPIPARPPFVRCSGWAHPWAPQGRQERQAISNALGNSLARFSDPTPCKTYP